MADSPPILAIVGPTAVGKSAVAMALAAELRADIVSADSRQVYRYMDIGTAKPTPIERMAVSHHLLDLVEPNDTFSAQRYQSEGGAVLRRLEAQGRTALVVGGTGFYFRALLDGLVLPSVAPNPARRQQLREEAMARGNAALHQRLADVDPPSADRIHPNNLSRVIRALEIVESTGGPIASSPGESIQTVFFGLRMDRNRLRERARRRVLRQIASGLVEECRLLLEMGYDPEGPALTGFGYLQMIRYLTGRLSLDEATAEYVNATNRYIRRQLTWFQADKRIVWVDADEDPVKEISTILKRNPAFE